MLWSPHLNTSLTWILKLESLFHYLLMINFGKVQRNPSLRNRKLHKEWRRTGSDILTQQFGRIMKSSRKQLDHNNLWGRKAVAIAIPGKSNGGKETDWVPHWTGLLGEGWKWHKIVSISWLELVNSFVSVNYSEKVPCNSCIDIFNVYWFVFLFDVLFPLPC